MKQPQLSTRKRREFLFFEWNVIDTCNFDCSYCIAPGFASRKPKQDMLYVKGREIEIARKIVQLSDLAERVVVYLTGGEPLICEYFVEVLTILHSASNLTLTLTSNLKLMDRFADDIERIFPSARIIGSLHVRQRTDKEMDRLIAFLKTYRDRLHFDLTQVNHVLTSEENARIARLKQQTGLSVTLQPFVPPMTAAGRVGNAAQIIETNFVSSLGKRCCLGYSHFMILPDATLAFDLWCTPSTAKKGNLLSLSASSFDQVILDGMKKCPQKQCPCNHNTFSYDEYLAAFGARGYLIEEVFGPCNLRSDQEFAQTGAQVSHDPFQAELESVWEFFGRKPEGFFVEVGANDPRNGSQTWFLEQHGWGGVLVEPQRQFYGHLLWQRRRSRIFRVACSAPEKTGVGDLFIPREELSNLATLERNLDDCDIRYERSERVAVTTLDALLAQAGNPRIDFLCIDTAGTELDVLRGFDTSRHRPALISIRDKAESLAKHRYLRAHGYKLVKRVSLNNWYVPRETRFSLTTFAERLKLWRKVFLGLPFRKFRRWRHRRRPLSQV